MIRSGAKRLPPGKPEHFRAMLIVFAIRHLLGIGVFIYLMRMALIAGGPFWMVLLALCVVYAAYAVYNGRKLFGQYQRTSRRKALERAGKIGIGA